MKNWNLDTKPVFNKLDFVITYVVIHKQNTQLLDIFTKY